MTRRCLDAAQAGYASEHDAAPFLPPSTGPKQPGTFEPPLDVTRIKVNAGAGLPSVNVVNP
jgi:hypothetical protein